MRHAHREPVLRDHARPGYERVGFIELFFDLVFVFAVTQLSHVLLAHPTPAGALEALFLLLAVWIVWMWTSWALNWLNPRCASVRLLLFALMGGGLVMAVAIPQALGARRLYFALAYALINVGRTSFIVWALEHGRPNERRNFERILIWMALSALLWIGGAVVEGQARWALWVAGLAIDLGAPWLRFWVPGLGRSSTDDWRVTPEHMAERCGLFVILALGESIILLGATLTGEAWTWAGKAAFASGFVCAAAMWWVYFATTAERAGETFAHHADPGRIARGAYTYSHIPIVAGIILTAVSDELVLAHPGGRAEGLTLASTLGGPALFLAGGALFNRTIFGAIPFSHLAGITALSIVLLLGGALPPLMLSVLTTGVLACVAAWETVAPTNRPRDAEPEAG